MDKDNDKYFNIIQIIWPVNKKKSVILPLFLDSEFHAQRMDVVLKGKEKYYFLWIQCFTDNNF